MKYFRALNSGDQIKDYIRQRGYYDVTIDSVTFCTNLVIHTFTGLFHYFFFFYFLSFITKAWPTFSQLTGENKCTNTFFTVLLIVQNYPNSVIKQIFLFNKTCSLLRNMYVLLNILKTTTIKLR